MKIKITIEIFDGKNKKKIVFRNDRLDTDQNLDKSAKILAQIIKECICAHKPTSSLRD